MSVDITNISITRDHIKYKQIVLDLPKIWKVIFLIYIQNLQILFFEFLQNLGCGKLAWPENRREILLKFLEIDRVAAAHSKNRDQ